MEEKYKKTVLDSLKIINKKTFLLVFFVLFFSLFVFFIPLQDIENTKIVVQAPVTIAAPAAPPDCTRPPCGPRPATSRFDGVGYLEKRDCRCVRLCMSSHWNCTLWYDVEWCGDGIVNDSEECDINSTSNRSCDIFNPNGNPPNDGWSGSPYDGLYLCNRCNWQYTGIDGSAEDSQICYSSSCAKSESQLDCTPGGINQSCDWAGNTYDCSVIGGNSSCRWDDSLGLACTPIDWCGDGKINGAELYCDTHGPSGISDFGGQTCASKICNDIDPTDTEDRSDFSKNPACSSQNFGGELTCANTCRHIYTVPFCEFPLNATGVDLSDDGQYVFVTDSSLWSLQMFPASKPEDSTINPDKLIAIYYLDTEPLSVDVVGNYAYVGTKGEFSVININQLNKPDEFPDLGAPYNIPPFRPKDNTHFPFREEQPPVLTKIPVLGEVNDVHIDGNYAYLAIGTTDVSGPAAVQVINISNPLNPVVAASFSHPNTIGGVRSIDVSTSYIFASYNDGNNKKGYFEYFRINPTFPSGISLSLSKTIEIGTSTSSIDIFRLYSFIDGLSTFHSVDIALPGFSPSVHITDNLNLGPDKPPNETFAIDIDNTGNFAYVSVKDIGLRAVNISDPENLSENKIFTSPEGTIMVDVIIDAAGKYAYAAGLETGLLVFNLEKNCGNGDKDGFEICEGLDLGGETCASQGFGEGTLLCERFCRIDTSGCLNCEDIGFSDPNCFCWGVSCDNPGPCETGPGKCHVENGGAVCTYPDNPNACGDPGFCLAGPGICNKADGRCYYNEDPELCDLDGNICTGDRCVSRDKGLTAECMPGANICGGIVPCGRMVNDPNTLWDDSAPCEFCHLTMLLNKVMNFLMIIVSSTALLALLITGFLYITSSGNPEKRERAKTALKWVIIGFIIVFVAWLLTDFILSAWGYLDPLGGKWEVVCE